MLNKAGVLIGCLLVAVFTAGFTVRADDEKHAVMGEAQADAEQMRSYLIGKYPDASEEMLSLPEIYLEEGIREGVRGDIAFAQACLETGNFRFPPPTAVTYDQYNFCGMGVTSSGMKGNSFASPTEGIRAQIQHLKAYATKENLVSECVDPRFDLVHRGCAPYVEWLGIQENPQGYGWAAGKDYGAKILTILDEILAEQPAAAEETIEKEAGPPEKGIMTENHDTPAVRSGVPAGKILLFILTFILLVPVFRSRQKSQR